MIQKQDLKGAEDVCIRVNKNLNFSKALIFVVENELHDMYDMMMQNGARFNIQNENGGKMFFEAVSKQNVQLCEKLFKDGIKSNTKDSPNPSLWFKIAILKIFEDELMEIFDLLPNYFGNLISFIDKENKTLLHDIIRRRNYKLCEKLITEGMSITNIDEEGNFPLHVAAEVNDAEIINLLIKKNADINAKNDDHQTALHLAAQSRSREAFCTLQQYDDGNSSNGLYVEYSFMYS